MDLVWIALIVGCGTSASPSDESVDPVDDVDDVGDPTEHPDVVVGGEIDFGPRMPHSMWFRPNSGRMVAEGPLHGLQYDAGWMTIEGRYKDGTTCSSPFAVSTASVSIGRDRFSNDIHTVSVGAGGDLLLSRQSFIERFSNNYFGVQQSWVFPFRPTKRGALTVAVATTGQEFLGEFSQGLHFAPPGDFGTTYSNGTWIDADGNQTTIAAKFIDGKIVLQVPDDVIQNSRFPAVLDPLIDLNEKPVDAPLTGAPTGANATSPSVASSGLDYLAVWRDDRNGADSDVFGMIVSSTGDVTTTTPNGVLISKATATGGRAPGVQSSPVTAFVNNSYLVVWQDFKSPAADSDLVAARVSTTGAVTLLGSIAATTAAETRPRIAVRGSEALVVFESGVGVQAIRYNGTSFTGGLISVAASGSDPSVAANPAGDYLVAYSDAASTNLLGQFVTSTGTLGAALTIADGAGAQETSASSFAAGNHIVVWQNNNGGRKLFGARVTPAGAVLDTHLEATLPVNGVQIGTSASLVAGASPGLVCGIASCAATWSDRRNFNTLGTGNDVFAIPFGFDLTFTAANEIALSTEAQDQKIPAMALATSTNRLLVLWDDLRFGAPAQITGTRVNVSGSGAAATLTMQDPSTTRIVVSVGANSQATSAVARIPNSTNWMVAWGDSRGTTGQNIQGTLVSDSLAIAPLGNTISNANGQQGSPAIAVTTSQQLVVWADARNGVEDIFGARVTSTGTVQDVNGLPISSFAKEQLRPAIASNGTTRYLVVWQDRGHNTNFDIYGAILDTNGAVVAGEIPISTAVGDQAVPSVSFDPVANQFVVVWQDGRAGAGERDIFAARVTLAGTVLDAAGVNLSNAAGIQLDPKIAFGSDRFMVVWEDRRAGTDVRGTRMQILNNALVVNDPASLPIAIAAGGQQRPSVGFVTTTEFAPVGTQVGVGAFAVVWDDSRTSATTGLDIFGTVVFQSSGNVGDEFPIAISTDTERAPEIGNPGAPQANKSLRMLVTYQRQNTAINAQRVVMRRVTFANDAFNCTTATCQQTCNNNNTACDVNCAGATTCTTSCNNLSSCFVNCEDSGTCTTTCNNGSNCNIDCRGAANCLATCNGGNNGASTCDINCNDPGTGLCNKTNPGITCGKNDLCLIRCVPGTTVGQANSDADCGFFSCVQGTEVDCDFIPLLASPQGAREVGTTVTYKTLAGAPHGFIVGQTVIVTGVATAGFNGSVTITSVPTSTSFTATKPPGLGNSGGGHVSPAATTGVKVCHQTCPASN